MTHTIPVSIDQLQRLEHRIGTLERAVRELVQVVESAGSQDIFATLYRSKVFEDHKKATLDRFKTDPTQFVDPFETYQPK
jgi:hypothetical protein